MASLGELVELGAAIVVGGAPLGADVTLLLQLEQRRIQRAVVELEQVATGLLDAPGEAVAMLGAHGFERFQNHQGQRALPYIGFVAHSVLLWLSNRSNVRPFVWERNRRMRLICECAQIETKQALRIQHVSLGKDFRGDLN